MITWEFRAERNKLNNCDPVSNQPFSPCPMGSNLNNTSISIDLGSIWLWTKEKQNCSRVRFVQTIRLRIFVISPSTTATTIARSLNNNVVIRKRQVYHHQRSYVNVSVVLKIEEKKNNINFVITVKWLICALIWGFECQTSLKTKCNQIYTEHILFLSKFRVFVFPSQSERKMTSNKS